MTCSLLGLLLLGILITVTLSDLNSTESYWKEGQRAGSQTKQEMSSVSWKLRQKMKDTPHLPPAGAETIPHYRGLKEKLTSGHGHGGELWIPGMVWCIMSSQHHEQRGRWKKRHGHRCQHRGHEPEDAGMENMMGLTEDPGIPCLWLVPPQRITGCQDFMSNLEGSRYTHMSLCIFIAN